MTRSSNAIAHHRWPVETIEIEGEILEMPAPHPLVQEVHDLEVRVVRLEERHESSSTLASIEKQARITENVLASAYRERVEARLARMEKLAYAGIGALAALQFVLKFIGKG